MLPFRNTKRFPVPTIKQRFLNLAFKAFLKRSQPALWAQDTWQFPSPVLLFMRFLLPKMLLVFGNPVGAFSRILNTLSLMLALLTFSYFTRHEFSFKCFLSCFSFTSFLPLISFILYYGHNVLISPYAPTELWVILGWGLCLIFSSPSTGAAQNVCLTNI